ncbi:MAG: hypothetical protein DF168_01339 [Candidatus Moanabacter tarae]|uniref:DUF4340 domain-containing protein n=1 Tax=Candidatus Moanibacter tarae TaxID=2200854 RepID=A0A2Z4AGD8_9BACT|nr:MAG: hypothetical protein DF168_01339 [Candidatus Moanabacter tarae]|tara:strand:- start:65990 stop:67138 length:1149 start_codon:yes stop_codon:yes gene_type:complete
MRLKRICLAIAILGTLAALALWIDRSQSQLKTKEKPVGENLVAHKTIELTSEILLGDSDLENKVHLKLEDNIWILPEYHQFPVDFNKLKSFVSSLLNAKFIRLVTRNPERMKQLEFNENTVRFISAEGENIWSLITGKGNNAGGRFVKVQDYDAAYLSDISLYIDTDEKNWAQKKLLDIKPNHVEVVKLDYPGEDRFLSIARATHDSIFSSENIAQDQEINDSAAKDLIRTLINARFSDVKEPDNPDALAAFENSQHIEFFLFGGETFSFRIGRNPAGFIGKTEAPGSPEPVETLKSEEGPDTGIADFETSDKPDVPGMTDLRPVFIFYSTANSKSQLNDLMKRVSLSYSDYTFDQINESITRLIQAKKEPKELAEESKDSL